MQKTTDCLDTGGILMSQIVLCVPMSVNALEMQSEDPHKHHQNNCFH